MTKSHQKKYGTALRKLTASAIGSIFLLHSVDEDNETIHFTHLDSIVETENTAKR